MRRRNSLAAAALVLALAAPASAQVSSAPLAQVDSWGVGWMSANDGALPATFWDNTGAGTLAPLMAALQPKDLSPSARTALRRILLSRSKGPDESASLTPERLRLLELIGESAHSADLRKRYASTEWGKQGDRIAAELALLNGETDAACAALTGKPATDAGWMPLRAACAAFKGDANYSLVAEQIARQDEPLGLWFVSALPAVGSGEIKKPEGRFATPVQAAVSVAALLPVPANAFAATPGDVAAAVALNPKATVEQRHAALRPAFAASKLQPADVLAILSLKDATPKPATRGAVRPDYIALAIAAAADKDAKPDARAAAYVAALRSAETLEDGRLYAAALAAAIKALPRNDVTLTYAEPLARAALLAGDEKLANDWRKHLASLPKDKQDAWALARLDLMLAYAGATNEKVGPILDRMLAAAPYPAPAAPGAAAPARAPTTGEQQLAVRRIENTRALFLAFGMGRDLSAAQRATLSAQRTAGRGVSDAAIARITAAARQNAKAEAALAALGQLGTDTSAVSFAGLADLLSQLREIGMTTDAEAIALESLQVWKAL